MTPAWRFAHRGSANCREPPERSARLKCRSRSADRNCRPAAGGTRRRRAAPVGELLARDVPERISDAITGHKTPGIGRKYEHVEMSKKFEAISKLPVIPLQAA
jgi:hypothetical protein